MTNGGSLLRINCDYCEEVYPSVYTLSLHVDINHQDKKVEFDKKYKIYACSKAKCKKVYYTIKTLQRHYREYHNDIITAFGIVNKKLIERTCKECGKVLQKISQEDWEDHMAEHRIGLGTRQFQCHICKSKFHYRSGLREHMDWHTDENILCPICGLNVGTKKALQRHHYRKHKEKKYKCKECGKGFLLQKALQDHMNVHLGLKPHICQHCGKGFRTYSNVHAHIKNVCNSKPIL